MQALGLVMISKYTKSTVSKTKGALDKTRAVKQLSNWKQIEPVWVQNERKIATQSYHVKLQQANSFHKYVSHPRLRSAGIIFELLA